MRKALKLGFVLLLAICFGAPSLASTWSGENEVFYQLMVRSFADSNGDRNGDLRGLEDKLGYLQHLGITSVLLTPIVPSPFYHNYFPTDFEGVDPAYGTMKDLGDLVKAAHARGMKIYLDEEFQYAAMGHPWFVQSRGHPDSKYGKYILYQDAGNAKPEGGAVLPSYDGQRVEIALVNLLDPQVKTYFERMFVSLTKLGIDGFRLDHMMDDLDNRGIEKNLFADFWAPVMAEARATNPHVVFIAEQADWGTGADFLTRGGVDMVFAFPTRGAIVSFDAQKIARAIDETLKLTPAGKGQLVFIENHDTRRFASAVNADAGMERVGAALNVLLKGTPLIYYGQEIGMKGEKHDQWDSDANDIPQREAFRWTENLEGPASAIWYKSGKPWWTSRFNRSNDGISVAREDNDPGSLLSYYTRLLSLRRARPEIATGDERVIPAGDDTLAVVRSQADRTSLLLVNLSGETQTVSVATGDLPGKFGQGALKDLLGGMSVTPASGTLRLALSAYEVKLLTPE